METLNNNQQTIGLQFFSDEDINANIRMLMIDESPWFVGRDIALSLGYSNPASLSFTCKTVSKIEIGSTKDFIRFQTIFRSIRINS